MKHNSKKTGFTLVELMVFFVFVSLVLAASAPIITKRVKYIPERVGHGKFMCYNGGHTQVYYNATKLISTESVSQCEFKPPKKNALFKIELIGAGAGGTSTSPYADTTMHSESGGYSLPGGPYGKRSINPTGPQLIAIFGDGGHGADFTIVQTSGAGGHGGSVTRHYTGITDPHINVDESGCFSSESYWADWCEYKVTVCDEDADGNCIYDCTPKLDADGNPILDADGNPEETCVQRTHEETRYGCTKMTENGDWDRDGIVEGPKKEECSDWHTEANKIHADIMSQVDCGSTTDITCKTIAYGSLVSAFQQQAYNATNPNGSISVPDFGFGTSATGSGAPGGAASKLRLRSKIDFCNYKEHPGGCGGNCAQITAARDPRCVEKDNVDAYLQSLFSSYIVTGTTKEIGPQCIGWGYNEKNEHNGAHMSEREPTKNLNLSNTDAFSEGKLGYDVLYYGAIKAWDKCATNTVRAEGGDGGWIRNNGMQITSTTGAEAALNPGKDAGGLVAPLIPNYIFDRVSDSRKIPSALIETELSQRNHYNIGYGGGSGSYRTYYISNLDSDCTFSVPYGGPVLSINAGASYAAALQESLATTMTCNEGTLRLSADGGYYNLSQDNQHYSGFNYVNLTTGVAEPPPEHVSSHGGGNSPYSPNDIYTKYTIGTTNFGEGGDGTGLRDGCTEVYGTYTHTLVRDNGSTKTLPKYTVSSTGGGCDPSKDVKPIPASSGSGGAIIISW